MKFFDIDGSQTGMPFRKKQVIGLIITAAVVALCFLLPLDSIEGDGSNVNLVLATVMFVVVAQITGWLTMAQTLLLAAFVWVASGIITASDVMTNSGLSSLYMMIGFFMTSMGASRTKLSKRLAYLLLRWLGKSPSLIVLAIAITTALLSSVLSNLATCIMMASVANELLKEVDEKPGQSQFGKCLMMVISVFACLGGMMLMNGCGSVNVIAVGVLESLGITVTYAQWAIMAFPIGVVSWIPVWFVYVKWFKVDKSMEGKNVDPQYFKDKQKELGPIEASEIRWLILMLGMVACLLWLPVNSAFTALLFGALSVCPVVGVVPVKEALQEIPWETIIGALLYPVMGVIITNSGLGSFLMDSLLGWAGNYNYIVMIIIAVLVCWLLNTVLVNCQTALVAVSTVALASMASSMGINAALLVMPTIFVYTLRHVLSMQMDMVVIQGYNFYVSKETIIPGVLSSIPWVAIIIIGSIILVPIAGL